MGLAVRASGAGLHVFILQFVKAKQPEAGGQRQSGEWPLSSEIDFFRQAHVSGKLGNIVTEQVGAGFVGILGDRKERDQHVREALRGLELARQILLSSTYGLVILDEIISALELKLIEERDILELLSLKPALTHVAITGHNKYPNIIKRCDLVTEMKMVKHPYYKGVLAQKGIDY